MAKTWLYPFGNAKTRAIVWTFPDRVHTTVSRFTPRRDLVAITLGRQRSDFPCSYVGLG
ncbi:hypothetical protein O9993_22695 [Vibrio lentus]|nr:hypothetical protein [Vibrio lentus]